MLYINKDIDAKKLIKAYYAYHNEQVRSIKKIHCGNFTAYRVRIKHGDVDLITICDIFEDSNLNPYVSEYLDGEDEQAAINEWRDMVLGRGDDNVKE